MSSVITLYPVYNRGKCPEAFAQEMVCWAKTAPSDIFARNNSPMDIYSKVADELGTSQTEIRRKAILLEVMRVLAGFESSWDWTEGVDTSRLGVDTPENAEAGAWQVSYDSKKVFLFPSKLLEDVKDGAAFQQKTKFNHCFAMEWVARLLRQNTKHNGPLYKGNERIAIRKSLRGKEHSIYPWLRKACVEEFIERLSR